MMLGRMAGMMAEGSVPAPRDASELQRELSALLPVFSLRDEVIRRWRSIARLSRLYRRAISRMPVALDQIDASLTMSLPATLVEETVRRCSSRRYQVRVALDGSGQEARQYAEFQEQVIQTAFGELNRHQRALGRSAGLDAEMYRWLVETGHCYELVRPQPMNASLPWRAELLDPETVYPVEGREGLEAVYLQRTMSARAIGVQFGSDVLGDRDPESEHAVTIHYDRQYLSVLVDGRFVREPMLHGYGCVPIIWTFANGLPGVSTEHGLNRDEIEAYRGRSILATVTSELEHIERVMETILYVTYRGANPPMQERLGDGVLRGPQSEPDLSPGTINRTLGTLEPVRLDHDAMRELQTTLAMLLGNVRAATLALADDRQFTSGFDRQAASRSAQTFLDPILEAAEWHIQRRGELVCKFLHTFGDKFAVTMPAGGGRSFQFDAWAEAVPADPRISVNILPMNELDQLQALTVGAQANAAGLMSAYDLFDKVLMYQDAEEMVQRARTDQLLRNPAVQEAQAPFSAAVYYRDLARTFRTQGDGQLAALASSMAQKYFRDIEMALQQPPPSPQQPPVPPGMAGPQAGQPMGPVPMQEPASLYPGGAMPVDAMAGMPGIAEQWMPGEMQAGGMPMDEQLARQFGQGVI